MGKQCWSQAVLESGSWGHSVLQTPALVIFIFPFDVDNFMWISLYQFQSSLIYFSIGDDMLIMMTAKVFFIKKYINDSETYCMPKNTQTPLSSP